MAERVNGPTVDHGTRSIRKTAHASHACRARCGTSRIPETSSISRTLKDLPVRLKLYVFVLWPPIQVLGSFSPCHTTRTRFFCLTKRERHFTQVLGLGTFSAYSRFSRCFKPNTVFLICVKTTPKTGYFDLSDDSSLENLLPDLLILPRGKPLKPRPSPPR